MESEVAKNTFNSRLLIVSLQSNGVAIAQLLQQQILDATGLFSMGTKLGDFSDGVKLTAKTIPLQRLSNDIPIIYRSAIAFKLASLWEQPALDIAEGLTASLAVTNENISSQTCLEFNVEVVLPGWINFRLNEGSLAFWLQQLIQKPSFWREGVGEMERESKDTRNLFSIQYAHARCCSLLRLAHREGLIKLKDFDFKTDDWQLVEPNPIPWLNERQEAATNQLILALVHPAERRLIAQILDVSDSINNLDQLKAVKLANSLSEAFEGFYSGCRIWGEVKIHALRLAQARLGLVGVTQGLLRSLLQDQLGVSAPVEL